MRIVLSRTAALRLFVGWAVACSLVFVAAVGTESEADASVQISGMTEVALGDTHAVAVSSDGSLWTWGSMIPGPTGVGSRYVLNSPTRVTIPGSRSAVAVAATRQAGAVLATDGSIWAWGYQGIGLGDSGSTSSTSYQNLVRVDFGQLEIKAISGSCEGFIAVDDNGDVWQWGSFWGIWTLSSNRPQKVTGVSGAVSVAKSCSSAYAVLSDGTVKAWGANGGGRLGDGTTTDRDTPVTVSISAKSISKIAVSESHVLVLTSDAQVWGWGSNSYSQLATDPFLMEYSASPRRISLSDSVGTPVAIATSNSNPSSFVVTSSGEIWEWGTWWRQAGNFDAVKRILPTELGSRKITSGVVMNGNALFVADDNSIWGRGQWVDGNCGAEARDYSYWQDGRILPPRNLVQTISTGQFGARYVEDVITIRRMTGTNDKILALDGSGTVSGRQETPISVSIFAASSACYSGDLLDVSFDFDGDGEFETSATSTQVDGEPLTHLGTYTPDWSGRRRGAVKITNPDGYVQRYSFWVGISAPAGTGGGNGASSVLPVIASSRYTSLSIGTDGNIYGWGNATPAFGTSSITPRRLLSNSNDQYIKLDFRVSSSSSVAAALTTDGEAHLWGRSIWNSIFFQSGSRVDEATDPYVIPKPFGVMEWIDVRIQFCAGAPYILLIGNDQQIYLHGIGVDHCVSSTSETPSVPDALSGITADRFYKSNSSDQNSDSGWFAFWSDDKWKAWNLDTRAGVPIDYSSSELLSSNLRLPSDIYRSKTRNSWCYYGGGADLEISANGQVQQVTRSLGAVTGCYYSYDGTWTNPWSSSVLTETSRQTLTSWTTRRALAVQGNTVIADDGTIWEWSQWSRTPLQLKTIDERVPIIRRFAGIGNYVVGEDASVWLLPYSEWDSLRGETLGNCGTAWSNDVGSAIRVFSNGQFGSAFTEDRFGFQVDVPSRVSNNKFYGGEGEYTYRGDDMGMWSDSHLVVRPSGSVGLYVYLHSSCDSSEVPTVEWDMDNDGDFDITTTVGEVEDEATPMATPVVDLAGDTQYQGFNTHWKQTRSPIIDLSAPGSRFINVRLTSSFGTQTKRIALTSRPQKPSGYVGVSVNSGARFTSAADVTLSLVWPEGATTALISNDGGFESAQVIPLSNRVSWRLPAEGSGLLGTSVYVRFYSQYPSNGEWVDEELGYQVHDDIVLDLSPPEVSSVTASSNQLLGSFALSGFSPRTTAVSSPVTATVNISAFDNASGIAGMQVTSDPAVPGAVVPFSRQLRVPIDRGRIAVRIVDTVGNWSNWHYARVSGFTAIPETPRPVAPEVPSTPVIPNLVPENPVPKMEQMPQVPQPQQNTSVAPVVPPKPAATASAIRRGTSVTVRVVVPAELAKVCKTKTVKKKKKTTCTSSQLKVSVLRGATKTVKAKKGTNSIRLQARKNAKITVRLNNKVLQTLVAQ